ncbi:MAG: inner membrane protein [Betaproteobacteria bacterium]|jgi:inner membrane protein
MPSIISHPAIPLAIGVGLGSGVISRRLLLAGIACSVIPDLDVYAQLYTASIGHRGITHSILFAFLCAAAAALIAPRLHARHATAFWFVFLATASHGVLDAFTNGGPGVTFFWPLSAEGYFTPFRVIEVSPIGISRFFSARGAAVLVSELKWVWLPALTFGAGLYMLRRIYTGRVLRAPT